MLQVDAVRSLLQEASSVAEQEQIDLTQVSPAVLTGRCRQRFILLMLGAVAAEPSQQLCGSWEFTGL